MKMLHFLEIGRAEEMAQRLCVLLLQRTQVQFPVLLSGRSQLLVAPILRELMLLTSRHLHVYSVHKCMQAHTHNK